MKEIGNARVFKVSEYQRKDGSYGARVQAFTEDGDVVVFYRPAEEKPIKDSIYKMLVDVDNKFSAVVRYQKVEK
jgi:hypothetical protein